MKCIICRGEHTQLFWDDRLCQCTFCGLVRAADRYFALDSYAAIYNESYYHGNEYQDYRMEETALRCNFRRRIHLLRHLAPHATRLLELGSGYGFFLDEAQHVWQVWGYELSHHAAQQSRAAGLDCRNEEYPGGIHAESFDIACLWDTIEHLTNPAETIATLAQDISPGGILAISTGNIDALLPRLQRHRWRLIHPPTHLWYFSYRTLTALLRTHGFHIVHYTSPVFYRSLGSLTSVVPRADRLTPYLPSYLRQLPLPLQTGDIMELYAQKIVSP